MKAASRIGLFLFLVVDHFYRFPYDSPPTSLCEATPSLLCREGGQAVCDGVGFYEHLFSAFPIVSVLLPRSQLSRGEWLGFYENLFFLSAGFFLVLVKVVWITNFV
jgi:hypothetical protein